MPHLAPALLQHRDKRVTDEHYNRASTMHAAIRYSELARGSPKNPAAGKAGGQRTLTAIALTLMAL